MASPVRFDAWQLKKPVLITERNRKKLTLSAFSAPCGHNKGCLNLADNVLVDLFESNAGTAAGATLMFWFKILPSLGSGGNDFIIGMTNNIGISRFSVGLNANNNVVIQSFETDAAQHVYTSSILLIENLWHHITVTQDNTTLKIYINGVLQETLVTTRFVDDTTVSRFKPSPSNSKLSRLAEIQYYPTVQDASKIFAIYAAPRSRTFVDTTLITYAPFNELLQSGTSLAIYTQGNPIVYHTGATSSDLFTDEDYPPLLYGASFAAAEWPLVFSGKFSFKFPIVPPTGTTFALGVRWVDEDGITQRRFLWELDGVDIAPVPALYSGEAIPATFVLEAYNVDGAATIDLLSDLDIYISISTIPNTDTDHDSQVAATPVIDTTLAANFPLTPFPVEFNTQQVYV